MESVTGIILDMILGPIGVILGAIVTALGAYIMGRQKGKKDQANEQMQDTVDRLQKGREALRDGRDLDPADRLRSNDGKW